MPETVLIARLRNKEAAACKYLVDEYGSLVFNTALGLLQHRTDAEDVAQEVFAYAFLSIDKFRGESKLSSWLYRITVNKSLDLIKAKKRVKRGGFIRNLFEPAGVGPATDVPHFEHPGVLMENQEQAKILFLAIEKLPERQKAAFVLHKLEDLSHAEIAEVMMLSISSVESLIFRARQNLRQFLGQWYDREKA